MVHVVQLLLFGEHSLHDGHAADLAKGVQRLAGLCVLLVHEVALLDQAFDVLLLLFFGLVVFLVQFF